MATDWTSIASVSKLAQEQETALGAMNSQVADTLQMLADLHFVAEDFANAEPIYWRVLSIRQKVLGEAHNDTALTLQSLAELYEIQDRYAEAQRFYRWATTARKAALVKQHSDAMDKTGQIAGRDQPDSRRAQLPKMSSLKDAKCSNCGRQQLDSPVCLYCTQVGLDVGALLGALAANLELEPHDGPVNVLIRHDGAAMYKLESTEVTIGRHPSNTIVLDSDPNVSRHHLVIHYDKGSFQVENVSGTNGTFLNSEKMSAKSRLRCGDKISLGNTVLVAAFQTREEA